LFLKEAACRRYFLVAKEPGRRQANRSRPAIAVLARHLPVLGLRAEVMVF
jgi:hypothetical protein